MAFPIFIVAVLLYATFLLWCLTLPFRGGNSRMGSWIWFTIGAMLLAGNLSPVFALPALPLLFAAQYEEPFAVLLFLRTTPKYVANLLDRERSTATIIDITYPIEIAGVRYAPVLRTACTTRKLIALDKFIEVKSFNNIPTASGGELFAGAGNAIVAVAHSNDLCSSLAAGRLNKGSSFDYRRRLGIAPAVYVVRGSGENTKLYQIEYHAGDAVQIDDIKLSAPQITHIETKPAKEVISATDLWPMRQVSEYGRKRPLIVQDLHRLPAGENACIEFFHASYDFRTNEPKNWSWKKTTLERVPAGQEHAYCQNVLNRMPNPTERLSPEPLS